LATSWYAAVETLKSPTTALFGVGSDNFISIFTRVKPAVYNQSDLWQLNFNKSRSFVLHIWTETGVLGLASFILMMIVAARTVLALRTNKNEHSDYFAAATLYMAIVLFIFPPSLPVLFLFFLLLALIGVESARAKKVSLDLNDVAPAYLGISIVSLLGLLGMFYLLGRAYMAEYYFKRSVNGLSANNGRVVYDNLVKAIQTNPYSETYHLTFSQINLLIANNIATRVVSAQKNNGKVSDQDRQTIAQAIQQAIVEAKTAVQLNPAKAQNWENLALIYRNIINVAQGGDSWTVASYQRAILSDPVNPQLRLNLGGVYYSLKNFPAAAQMFQQAIELKRDWANAHIMKPEL
jgi:tetratricopeptide (TPR) repeat protein